MRLKGEALFCVGTTVLSLSATALTYLVIFILVVYFPPQDGMLGMWIIVNQPAYWLLSALLSFPLNKIWLRRWSQAVPLYCLTIIIIVVVGSALTYLFLWLAGAVGSVG